MQVHTPGPWLVQHEGNGELVVWTRQPHTGALATVHSEDINGEYPAEANARLIASAPDLLSIARRWMALNGEWHPTRYAAEKARLIDDTRAALRKAGVTDNG
ncbi:hypothetical protein TSH7_01390 [Azospirillum sp. TSH7]|nr:hypothetical protein TSH7_01390 [Azospirillum sp. TSH7]PWC71382.1 hypothetical protein TSH20_03685 [Azospirillum sp. TSH20]